VVHFVKAVRALADEEVIAEYRKLSWSAFNATADEVRDKVEVEVLGNLRYVLHEAASEKQFHNGVRDLNRGPVRLEHFVQHTHAQEAELSEAHVIALRLYTTHAFKYLVKPLREVAAYYEAGKPHPLPLLIAYISDGIKKLRAVRSSQVKRASQTPEGEERAAAGEERPITLWRGMKNLRVTDDFMRLRQGGTELAPMSTTTDLDVAVRYGRSEDSLMLKITAKNFMQLGADLQWLSAFPTEAEVCYPPLTYLQPSGRMQAVEVGAHRFTVIEVEPHIP